MRPPYRWNLGDRTLELGERTLIMGIVNVTPDSFSDAGQHHDRARAVEHALRLLDEGADIIDIGGESTRPGTRVESSAGSAPPPDPQRKPISPEEELSRVMPVIGQVRGMRPQAVLSIDTYKACVARAAVESGVDIVNDVSGLLWDRGMAETVAGLPCGLVVMHMRGLPETWRQLPPLDDVAGTVKRELEQRVCAAEKAGIARARMVIDPGIGFGKNYEENYPLLAHLEQLQDLGLPILAGTSRKSFVGKAVAQRLGDGTLPSPQERLYGSLAAMVITILKGAHIVRVHDVKAAVEAAAMADAIVGAE